MAGSVGGGKGRCGIELQVDGGGGLGAASRWQGF
jgi:hypothetical protein